MLQYRILYFLYLRIIRQLWDKNITVSFPFVKHHGFISFPFMLYVFFCFVLFCFVFGLPCFWIWTHHLGNSTNTKSFNKITSRYNFLSPYIKDVMCTMCVSRDIMTGLYNNLKSRSKLFLIGTVCTHNNIQCRSQICYLIFV